MRGRSSGSTSTSWPGARSSRIFPKNSRKTRRPWRAIVEVAGDEPFENLQKRILEVVPAMEKPMATAAEQLIQDGVRRGKAEGKAEALLAIFETRGLAVGAEQRARILECRDIAELDRWLRKAITAHSVAELFSH
jgi:hypothetical protein